MMKSINKLNQLIVLITLSFSHQAMSALKICDSSFNNSNYDFVAADPDFSHDIFEEPRWRCVTANLEGQHGFSNFIGFDSAYDEHCAPTSTTTRFFKPDDNARESIEEMVDIIREAGTLHEYSFEEKACIKLNRSLGLVNVTSDSFIGKYDMSLHPMGFYYYSGEIEGEEIKSAGFVPWQPSSENILDPDNALYLEYMPRFEVSRCFDPICEAGATGVAQYVETPIEASHGTVDVTLPILSDEFPGLLPLSLHYSSWSIVKKAKSGGTDSIPTLGNLHETQAESAISHFWSSPWHHSFAKRLAVDYYGDSEDDSGDGIHRIYLYLPSQDILVFEQKSGSRWESVSHPGVRATISQTSDSEFEVRRPDGYFERYSFGALVVVHYPDGREITLNHTKEATNLTAVEITQNYPAVGAVIVQNFLGEIQQIRSLYDKEYAFDFEYRADDKRVSRLLVAIQRPDGTRFEFGQTPVEFGLYPLSLLTAVSLDGQELMRFSYDTKGRGTAISYPSGEQFSMAFSGKDDTQIKGPYGASYDLQTAEQDVATSDFFDDIGIPSITKATCTNCGYSKTLTYGAEGQISSINRSGDLPYQADFSTQGLLSDIDFDASQSHNYTWDSTNRWLTGVSGTDILNTSIRYNNGHVSGLTSRVDDASRDADVSRGENGEITQLAGVYKNQLIVGHSAEGFIDSLKNSLGHEIKFNQFNHLGQPQTLVDPNGVKTSFAYDKMGRLLSYQRDDGEKLSVKYNNLGLPTSGSVNGSSASFDYDSNLRLKSISSTCRSKWDYNYKDNGLLASAKQSHNGVSETTSYDYDAEGRVQSTTVNYGTGPFVVNYNKRGQVTSINDSNNITQYSYDGNGRPTSILHNDEQEAVYATGDFGRVLSVSAPGGRETTFGYTGLGQLSRQDNNNWGYREYQYSDDGLLSGRQTPNYDNQFSYDDIDRRQSITYSRKDAATPAITVNYGYDDTGISEVEQNYGIGRLTLLDNNSTGYSYRYDISGNISQQTITHRDSSLGQASINYAYDQDAQITELQYPSGDQLAYEREPCSGEVTAIKWNGQILAQLGHASQLNAFSEASLSNGLSIHRSFDERKRLTQTELQDASGTPVWQQNYNFDNKNNLIDIKTANDVLLGSGDQLFAYDNNNRLIQAEGAYGTLQYAYDEHSHRISTTDNGGTIHLGYVDNKDNLQALTAADGAVVKNYSTDEDGYRTTGGEWAYRYDAAGRLSEVSRNGEKVATYAYDANGKRVSKTTADGTLYFYYDIHGRLLQETQDDGKPVRQYIYTELGELIAVADADAQVYFVHSDHLGTPLYLTDKNGGVVWSAVRKPFGETAVTSATVDFPIRLPGQYFDSETGLHYNQQRYYDPETGQYLRPDPLSLRGGYHTYNYAGQNPLAYVDPEGDLFFLAAIPYIVTGISAAMTAYEVYDTVDGLASGRVTKEDLAAGYLQDKAIDVGIKAIPGIGSTAYLVRKSLKRSNVDATKSAPSKGIYEFTDKVTGKPYVGQSGNISKRLKQHEKTGKLDPGCTVCRSEVAGGKTAREIAEHRRIQELTGGVPARRSPNVSNKVDPIGPKRQHLLE